MPRASELLKLAVGFSVSYLPWILGVVALFAAIYANFGAAFVHGGDPTLRPPPQYDPDQLLAEDTYYPMVPMQAPDPRLQNNQ